METLTARLFPLPDVVFFPRTNLPLHIFEPRYRQLMRDALAGDRRIAIALLQPGWEADYEGSPAVHPICCVGVISSHEELDDGRFNLVLLGEQRIRICDVIQKQPYRTVTALPVKERPLPQNPAEAVEQQERILALAMEYFRLSLTEEPDFSGLQGLDYEGLVNSLAAHLSLPAVHKQQLLELDHLEQRGKQVARFLQLQIQDRRLVRKFRHLSPKEPERN